MTGVQTCALPIYVMSIASRALGLDGSYRDGTITHTTSDFPTILANVANKVLQKAYSETPTKYQSIVYETSASNFQPVNVVRTGSFPILSAVPAGTSYKYVTIGEEGEVYQVGTFGNKFTITRESLVNDNLGAFTRTPAQMGRAARRTVDVKVFGLFNDNGLMSDGNAVFSSAHKNIGDRKSVV